MRKRAHRHDAMRIAIVLLLLSASPLAWDLDPGPGDSEPGIAKVDMPWRLVAMPAMTVAVVARQGNDVLAGGNSTANGRIMLVRVAEQGTTTSVTLRPRSTYASHAHWRSIAASDSSILGIAGMSGGAHSITRWTVWSGRDQEVVEHPQAGETFGGSHAGGLAVVGQAGSFSFIAGAWDGTGGRLDVAVWGPGPDDTWIRQSSRGTPLGSNASRQQQVGGGTALQPGRAVLVGSAVNLGGPTVTESAVVWLSDGPSRWTTLGLPSSEDSASARSVACTPAECWVCGVEANHLALWRVAGSRVQKVSLPFPLAAAAPTVHVATHAGAVYLAIPEHGILERRPDGRWTLLAPPPRVSVTDLVVTDTAIVAKGSNAGRDELWISRLGRSQHSDR